MEVRDGNDTIPLREYSKREKLRRIRAATRTLMDSRPFADVTMRDVAAQARVGEATLFRYVGTKEQLLLLVFGSRVEEQMESLEADRRFQPVDGASGRDVVEAICALFRTRAELYLEDPVHLTEFVRAGLAPDNDLSALTVAAGDRLRQMVTRLLSAGQAAGVIDGSWSADVIAENCAGAYIHEVLRSPVRKFETTTFMPRIEARLRTQLEPLIRTTGQAIGPSGRRG